MLSFNQFISGISPQPIKNEVLKKTKTPKK